MVGGCDRRRERDEEVLGLGHGDGIGERLIKQPEEIHRATLRKAGIKQQMLMVLTAVTVVVVMFVCIRRAGRYGRRRSANVDPVCTDSFTVTKEL